MHTKRYHIALWMVLVSISLVSCEEPFDADLDTAEPQVVIEAMVNDADDPAGQVRVSRTAPYLDPDTYRPITDATVVISDDQGIVDTLEQDSVDAGLYWTDELIGEVGRTYTLRVIVEDVLYSSISTMRENYDMDSVWFVRSENLFGTDSVWQFWGAGREPAGMGDFGLFQTYRNDTILTDLDDWFVLEDDVLDGNYLVFPFAEFNFDEVQTGDKMTLEVASISQETYDYLQQVRDLMAGIGGPFSPIPTNPVNNISNGALGQFRVSSVTRKIAYIPEQ